jgi:hypothetical protein
VTTELVEAIRGALGYLEQEGVAIPLEIQLKAFQFGAIKAEGDLSAVNAYYHDELTQALTTYFEGGSITGPRNQAKRAVADAFLDSFELGYTGSGGELPMEEELLAWLDARINTEWGFVAQLFEQARELRKDEEIDTFAWISEKADGYTRGLQGLFNAGGMFAKKNQVLTWHLGNTEKHCGTCADLNGKSHKATWYLARNYIPRQPGAAMECGGYHCDCSLTDKDGNEVTI